MVQFNFGERTIKAKIVYYGPPQSGKTTNLEQIHKITDPDGSNRLISLNTAQDRTLFFDLLPFSLGSVSGYDFKVQLYTVPGQVQYNATRRVVLAGADGVVFVADSQKTMARENLTAFENMKVNLLANRLVPEKVPLVVQYNKQDLEGLLPRSELDRTLNFWGRKAFPAVAARGEGVMPTFVAIVQEMLAAIAVKYNLKDKGLDPDAVPEIVAQAFDALLRDRPGPGTAPAPPAAASRVVIAQPDDAEPAYPSHAGPEANPVSEELLHRAIRSNVSLAETLGQLVRDFSVGLAAIQTHVETLSSADPASRATAAAIRRETVRLRQLLQELGRSSAQVSGAALPAQPAPAPAPSPRAAPPPALTRPPLAGVARDQASFRPEAPADPMPRPGASVPGTPVAALGGPVTTLDALLSSIVTVLRVPLGTRGVVVESRVASGTPLPRCSPAGLRRTLAAFVEGLSGLVAPSSKIGARAERKPVLLRGRDGAEVKRDFLMLTLTHAGGLAEADQQRILKGADTGPLGEGHKLLREMGGFLRFAPLPGGALETRLFLPL
jgi:signal recognition particle receptor subunit beta